ncbi:hypothetical protein GW17_00052020 [Ensete ventricosum]|nr:hypothetical protein GW17_00052020 [Ensete ventricosum]
MTIVAVEMALASIVMLLRRSPHRVGGLEESFLSDLEEDLGPSEVWAEGLIFLLPHPNERHYGWLQPGASKEVSFELSLELSKEWIEEGGNRLYHPRAILRRVVGKVWHIMASDVPYKVICALNAATCSIGSEPPLYASSIGSRKCYGMGLS